MTWDSSQACGQPAQRSIGEGKAAARSIHGSLLSTCAGRVDGRSGRGRWVRRISEGNIEALLSYGSDGVVAASSSEVEAAAVNLGGPDYCADMEVGSWRAKRRVGRTVA